MTQAVTFDQAKNAQAVRYLTLSLKAEAAIEESLGLCETRKMFTADPQEMRELRLGASDLHGKRAKVSEERFDFVSNLTAIKPPSKADVDKMVALSETIDRMTANTHMASALLASATAVVELWSKTNA